MSFAFAGSLAADVGPRRDLLVDGQLVELGELAPEVPVAPAALRDAGRGVSAAHDVDRGIEGHVGKSNALKQPARQRSETG